MSPAIASGVSPSLVAACRAAPLLARYTAMLVSLQDTATNRGVAPVLSWLSSFALPSSTNALADSSFPAPAALCRAVLPVLSLAFTLAPACNSSRRMAT
eukprot:GHRR01032822.1.p1 GENE.GHRR01032822.1~~GHRR01032822.1.p1  ORF type:complete len:110 (-),score=22.60 GHRR01032822.1:250-546(-)